MWTLVVALISGGQRAINWRQVFNPPLLAILTALGLNWVGVPEHLPHALVTALHLLGQCSVPLGLLLVGATMADQLGQLRAGEGWFHVAPALALRLAILPLGIVLLARCVPASAELKRVLAIQAAMPAAVFPVVLARHYGGDAGTALRIVIGTSVISLATTPLWIRFGMKWLNL